MHGNDNPDDDTLNISILHNDLSKRLAQVSGFSGTSLPTSSSPDKDSNNSDDNKQSSNHHHNTDNRHLSQIKRKLIETQILLSNERTTNTTLRSEITQLKSHCQSLQNRIITKNNNGSTITIGQRQRHQHLLQQIHQKNTLITTLQNQIASFRNDLINATIAYSQLEEKYHNQRLISRRRMIEEKERREMDRERREMRREEKAGGRQGSIIRSYSEGMVHATRRRRRKTTPFKNVTNVVTASSRENETKRNDDMAKKTRHESRMMMTDSARRGVVARDNRGDVRDDDDAEMVSFRRNSRLSSQWQTTVVPSNDDDDDGRSRMRNRIFRHVRQSHVKSSACRGGVSDGRIEEEEDYHDDDHRQMTNDSGILSSLSSSSSSLPALMPKSDGGGGGGVAYQPLHDDGDIGDDDYYYCEMAEL